MTWLGTRDQLRNLTRLYHETAQRVELKDLETICQYLNCEVGELLEL